MRLVRPVSIGVPTLGQWVYRLKKRTYSAHLHSHRTAIVSTNATATLIFSVSSKYDYDA